MFSKSFVKYLVIGTFVTLLYGVVLSGFIELCYFNPVLANALTFAIVNAISYLLQSRFVFGRQICVKSYLKFVSSYAFAFALTLLIAYLVELCGAHYLIGYFIISALAPIANFVVLKLWVFREG
ncbi:MAG: GtrA family protein [Helicobacteraceae bacterium]|jgi:putative flippase GtrA|nr:GtrA family protein [Helicobacteraceae bacterium]